KLFHARARILLAVVTLVFTLLPVCAATLPQTGATAAVLMNARTGKLLYAKNSDRTMAPASTTKIMTAILVLEHLPLDRVVKIQSSAASKEGSSMYLVAKEQKTVRELLYGLLLVSGNDAATALAQAVSGTEANFAKLMNKKAALLGMKNSHFLNASGLPAKGHYSTAYDLALLTRYAMQNGNFAKIVSTKVKEVPGAKAGQTRRLINHNKLLWRYQYTTGVKTGYTIAAGGCLVSTASHDGVSLISVVLKSSYIYDDSQKLLSYGFKQSSRTGSIAATTDHSASKS
ncbi:MAG TPA: D-alanyl-D-alanine carboxypeptidase family protein, partial [Bacillota bacterium]